MSEYEQGQWDMFVAISSRYHGKQYYFLQDDLMVYSRESGKYMDIEDAYEEFLRAIE